MSIRIMSIFGTRPEAIKMLPLCRKILQTNGLSSVVCVTAQHREMLDQVMDSFHVKADYDLNLMKPKQTLTSITADVLAGLADIFTVEKPDLVLVHGDTTTSFAAALAAFYQQIPVGHVEAGLRTYNLYSPFPEEANRNLTSRLATLHFAPTMHNVHNLSKENITKNVFQTGNTVIDALRMIVRDNYVFKNERLNAFDFKQGRVILLTAHRRENLGEPMRQIFQAVLDIANQNPDVRVIYPVHKNPAVSGPAGELLGVHPQIALIDPIDVEDMHNLMDRCYLVMTDSGGLQEEAPALGKPVLVLRTETERPEAVEAGVARVVGVGREDIVEAAALLLNDEMEYRKMACAVNPYGDGHASERICEAILTYFRGNPPRNQWF